MRRGRRGRGRPPDLKARARIFEAIAEECQKDEDTFRRGKGRAVGAAERRVARKARVSVQSVRLARDDLEDVLRRQPRAGVNEAIAKALGRRLQKATRLARPTLTTTKARLESRRRQALVNATGWEKLPPEEQLVAWLAALASTK